MFLGEFIFEIMVPLLKMIPMFLGILLLPLGLFLIVYFALSFEYKKSDYYSVTHKSLMSLFGDIGAYGEFMTYIALRRYEKQGAKFLFNVYIPKSNSETSEIDILMISRAGLFVFESKNYSGWIFGDEGKRYWYQTLPQGRGKSSKESFYNPVMQNALHIKHLKEYLGEDLPMYSVVVFSKRCELKNVMLKSSDVHVVKRENLRAGTNDILMASPTAVSDEDIVRIYEKLYPLTQFGDDVKKKHVEDINKLKNSEMPFNVTSCIEKTFDRKVEVETVASADEVSHEEKVCPRCGKKLVLRTATKGKNVGGKFWGCSGYPKCRYIKTIGDDTDE